MQRTSKKFVKGQRLGFRTGDGTYNVEYVRDAVEKDFAYGGWERSQLPLPKGRGL
jgi:hypothetical protein